MDYNSVFHEVYITLLQHFESEIQKSKDYIILTDPDGKEWKIELKEN